MTKTFVFLANHGVREKEHLIQRKICVPFHSMDCYGWNHHCKMYVRKNGVCKTNPQLYFEQKKKQIVSFSSFI